MNMDELEKKAQKGLESFSKKEDIESVKSKLDGLVDDMLGEEEGISGNKSKGRNVNWVYLAIAVFGLALIGYLGYKDGSKKVEIVEAPVLYAQYFEVLPDATSANERGTDQESEIKSDADLGMDYYNKGNYESAATILTQQDEVDYMVFGAISEMKNENHEAAIDLLLKSQKVDSANKYKDIIEWYLALAKLKNGNTLEAKTLLSLIADKNHYKKDEANLILKSLK